MIFNKLVQTQKKNSLIFQFKDNCLKLIRRNLHILVVDDIPYQNGNIVYNENMKISPDELEAIILELKNQGVLFLSLDQLVEYHHQSYKGLERFVVITLDDGYYDNLKYGLPLFKKHNVP